MDVDITIVGAGLAGLSAALEIAAHSRATIVVVERRVAGSNNPTPMTFADVPRRYGLEDCVIGRYDRFTFHSPLGNCSTHDFERHELVALAYQQACLRLLDQATSAGNVWLYAAAATGMFRQGNHWIVTLNDGRQLNSSMVIDASGRGLFTSRVLHQVRPKNYSHCFGVRLSHCKIPNPQETFFFAPSVDYGDGGGWLYPLDGRQASFGFAILSSSPVMPGGSLKANFKRALAEFQPYAQWLEGAVWEHVEVGSIPLYPLRRFVQDGVMITGDAAGQATIWSCMGSEAALEAGRMAGETALYALHKGDFSARTLSRYQREWDSRYRSIYRHNAWITPVVWSQTEADWNRQIPRVEQLTPEQMLARLRINWPVPTLPQAIFVRSYDLAGRARRGLARRLSSLWGQPGQAVEPAEPRRDD